MTLPLTAALARYEADTEARRALRSLRHESRLVVESLQVAGQFTERGAHRLAALWLASALRRASSAEWTRVAYPLGNALRRARHEHAAARILEAVCERRRGWNEPARSLAWLYRNAGQVKAATVVVERSLAAPGTSSETLRSGAGFLFDMGRLTQAEALLARIENPDVQVLIERGSLLLRLGCFRESETLLHESLHRDPTQGGAWLKLVQVRRWASAEDSPLADLQAARAQPGLSAEMQAAIASALVKVNDDLGRYEQAWAEAEAANRLRSRSAHFDRAAWQRYERSVYQVFGKSFLEKMSRNGGGCPAPVFIIGMPRAGTTLVERRLGRHSRLVAAGELEVVEALGLELTGNAAYPQGLLALPEKAFAETARQWPRRIPQGLKPGCEAIDKNPLNFLHLGLIALLFPHARIVHCRRDPLDTALSLWFQNFAHPRGDYSYRMEDLAWMIGLYRRLMAWWEQVLPLPIYTLHYEKLIADPERELRALVQALRVQWEPELLDLPADNEDGIATASLWQARQPVYARSVGRARHYESWIAPLREALHTEGVLD
ncbi:MAG: sulfotransferase [Gammaproteobacteria bacterium]